MTRIETGKLMAIFKVAYPDYYRGFTDEDTDAAINLWAEFLEPYITAVVMSNAKELIASSPYAPKISDLMTRLRSEHCAKIGDAEKERLRMKRLIMRVSEDSTQNIEESSTKRRAYT